MNHVCQSPVGAASRAALPPVGAASRAALSPVGAASRAALSPVGAASRAAPPHPAAPPRRRRRPPTPRRAFTLFELILAIALSATLLALIGTAINLYLLRIDASRTRVEEAQLARAILATIADDLRAAATYQPQDTSAIAELMAQGTPFDVDSIDQPGTGSSGGTEGPGGAEGVGGPSALGGSASASNYSASSQASGEPDSELPLGLNGMIDELYIDAARFPRRDELFGTITGYTNAPMAAPSGRIAAGSTAAAMVVPPSDLKTVRYFLRQGQQVGSGSVAATALAPQQGQAGGLVRQELYRPARVFAEQSGNSAMIESGQVLIAPEVVHLEFRYFDGQQLIDTWDMQEAQKLPLAVEVRLWIATAEESGPAANQSYGGAALLDNAQVYRQWVYLPASTAADSSGGESSSGNSASGSSSGSSSSSGASTSSGF